MTRLCLCIGLLFTALSTGAATLHVPGDHPAIQAAIVAASTGDSVLVGPGTYVENINYLGKSIAVMSTAGPAATIIDGSNPTHPDSGSVVLIPSAPNSPLPLLEGFTVTGGRGTLGIFGETRAGGGIAILGSAVIRDNWITENHLPINGNVSSPGIFIRDGAQNHIAGNRIFANSAISNVTARGGGIGCWFGSNGIIEDNEIFNNFAGDTETCKGAGGGIYTNGLGFTVRHNVIACNLVGCQGAGIFGGLVKENNTIVGNQSFVSGPSGMFSLGSGTGNSITHNIGEGVSCNDAGTHGSCNNIFGNTVGTDSLCVEGGPNISVDPLYGDEGCGASYCLAPGSPLLPENSPPGCGLIGARGLCTTTGWVVPDAPTSPAYASGPMVAYPNPFNPATTIEFRLDRDSVIELDIVDANGRIVANLHRGFMREGEHRIRWDGRDARGTVLASGAYIAVLRSPTARFAQKLLLLK